MLHRAQTIFASAKVLSGSVAKSCGNGKPDFIPVLQCCLLFCRNAAVQQSRSYFPASTTARSLELPRFPLSLLLAVTRNDCPPSSNITKVRGVRSHSREKRLNPYLYSPSPLPRNPPPSYSTDECRCF